MSKNKSKQIFVDPAADFPLDTPEKVGRANLRTSLHLATKPLKTTGEKVMAFVTGTALMLQGLFCIPIVGMMLQGEKLEEKIGVIAIAPLSVVLFVYGSRVLINLWLNVWGFTWSEKTREVHKNTKKKRRSK